MTIVDTSLFASLSARLGVEPDRRGECHIRCPWCGKEPARGQVHASFSERGFHCFVCGQSASLARLAWVLGVGAQVAAPLPVRQADRRPRLGHVPDFERLCRVFEAYPGNTELWRRYKPVWPETVAAYRLGYGVFPEYSSRCQHPRLMVPLIARGRVVGFRGRRTDACTCDDKAKWLSPLGTRHVLYNGERLGTSGPSIGFAAGARRAEGKVLFIVENPIDALLLEQLGSNVCAVATLSVSMWDDDWTRAVAQAGAKTVIVAYDNDRPGNGGGERGREEWLRAHPRDIMPGGVRLVNRLLEAGVRAKLFPWGKGAAVKTDIGDLLREGAA